MQRSFTFALLLVVCFVVSAAPVAAQDASASGPVGLRHDAPEYALHGPYWVGTQDFVIDSDSGHLIPLTVWYPALNPGGLEEATTYTWVIKWAGFPEDDYVAQGRALRDAEPDATDGPYPLVVFSHGFAESAAAYVYLLEHLASYGFVVAAPEHSETLFDLGQPDAWRELSSALAARPQDIVRVLDYADGLTASTGALEGLIDMNQVALAGHSAGGYTSLIGAGAHFDASSFLESCPTVTGAAAVLCDEVLIEPVDPEAVEARIESLWPPVSDPRIKAVIPMADDGWSFGIDGLADLTVPMLAMAATSDSMAPYEIGLPLVFERSPSPQKTLVSFTRGDHFLFQTECNDVRWLRTLGYRALCSDPSWDMDRAHDLINHFTTAFLLSTLKGDAEATTALSPDAVIFPGITYQAEGF